MVPLVLREVVREEMVQPAALEPQDHKVQQASQALMELLAPRVTRVVRAE